MNERERKILRAAGIDPDEIEGGEEGGRCFEVSLVFEGAFETSFHCQYFGDAIAAAEALADAEEPGADAVWYVCDVWIGEDYAEALGYVNERFHAPEAEDVA